MWVFYRAPNASGVETIAGRGWYLRTTDASFEASDNDWVRLRYGPLDLSQYNATSIAYFQLGPSGVTGSTGKVEFRNIKLEVLDSFTGWSAAPEDLYGLADRMASVESRISQNATGLTFKVSTSLYNTEKVYRSNTAPTTLYTNMLWLDTSLSRCV